MDYYKTQSKRNQITRGDGPREILEQYGPLELADWELIAILLGAGGKGHGVVKIANELLALLDKLGTRNPIPPEHLYTIPGIGLARASRIIAAIELGRRIYAPSLKHIGTPPDVLPHIAHYQDRPQEHFLVLSLNGAHEVLGVYVISIGLVNRTLVHPREVFAQALQDRATSIIVAHNHPSGKVDPSYEDRRLTKRLREVGDLLGIPLLDHIIFTTGNKFYSFLEEGEFPL